MSEAASLRKELEYVTSAFEEQKRFVDNLLDGAHYCVMALNAYRWAQENGDLSDEDRSYEQDDKVSEATRAIKSAYFECLHERAVQLEL